MRPPAVLAIHGGAGPADHDDPAGTRWPRQAAGLTAALRAGLEILTAGGPALDAAVAAVAVLEDDDQWNAGRGSALTAAGTVEMDAAVADGHTGRFGAVAAVTGIRHPIHAARAVLEDARHVLLAGPGAEAFARTARLEFMDPEWFVTPRRRQALARTLESAAGRIVPGTLPPVGPVVGNATWRSPGGPAVGGATGGSGGAEPPQAREAGTGFGTVGAVARDINGHLAAATSTGGRTAQLPGRIGDSPIPGSGTWADDATCAISATGIGEAFLRAAFAHEVDARLRLGGADLETACQAALAAVTAAGGNGGCVALASSGPPALPFTTALMHRGWAEAGGTLYVGAGPGSPERVE